MIDRNRWTRLQAVPNGVVLAAASGDESPCTKHVRNVEGLARASKTRAAKAQSEPQLSSQDININQMRALEMVADAVGGAMRGIGHRQLGRRLGRDMCWTMLKIYREGNVTVSTLADIALATGHRLQISFEKIEGK